MGSQHGGADDWSDVQRLEKEALALRKRLHQVAVALGMTEEMLADTLRHMAERGGPPAERYLTQAKTAERAANELRELVRRLEASS